MEALLIEETNADSFNQKCRELIEEGWKPMFPAQIYSVEGRASGSIIYSQQFWRKGNKEAEKRFQRAVNYLSKERYMNGHNDHQVESALRIAAGIHK